MPVTGAGSPAALAAIGAAHHYDTQVRTHFIKTEGPTVGSKSYALQDALPAVAALGATWVWAGFTESSAGHREAWSMLEAASLSSVTSDAVEVHDSPGRPLPDQ